MRLVTAEKEKENPMLSDSFVHARLEVFQRARLLERCGGDAGRAQRIVTGFLHAAPQMLVRLTQAVAAGDTARAQREAEWLKGRAQALGAEGLVWVSLNLEETARRGELSRTTALLAQVEGEVRRVHPRLEDYLRAA